MQQDTQHAVTRSLVPGSGAPDGTATGTAHLAQDTIYELMMNRRRRETLRYLLAHDGRSTLSDLAEHIAALENGIEVAQLSSDQRKRVYIGLYQSHLPKMDAAGVVDFDKDRGTVLLREETRQLVPYLDDGTPLTDTTDDGHPVRATAASTAIAAVVGVFGLLVVAPVVGLSVTVEALAALLAGAGLVAVVTAVREAIDRVLAGRGDRSDDSEFDW